MDANVNTDPTDKEDDGHKIPQSVRFHYYRDGVLYPDVERFYQPGNDDEKSIEPANQTGAKKGRFSYDHDNHQCVDEEEFQKALSYSIQPPSNQTGANTSRVEYMETDSNYDTNIVTVSDDDDDDMEDDEYQRILFLSMSSYNSEQEQQRKPDQKLKGVCRSPDLKPLFYYRFNEALIYSPPPRGEASTSSYADLSACVFCADHRLSEKMHKLFDCKHRFCSEDCASSCLWGLIKSDIFKVKCPAAECDAVLDLNYVYRHAPDSLKRRWSCAYKETEALEQPVWLQCTYFRCEKTFSWDYRSNIKACPYCGGLLCVKCKVSYHNHFRLTCEEYQAKERERKRREEARRIEREKQELLDRILEQSYRLGILRRRGENGADDEEEDGDEEEEEE